MRKIYAFLFAVLAVCGLANAQVVFDIAANPWGLPLGSGQGESAEAGDVAQIIQDNVAINLSLNAESGTPPRMWTGNQLRIYGNNVIEIVARQEIHSVIFTFTVSNAKDASNNDINYLVAPDGSPVESKAVCQVQAMSATFNTAHTKGHFRISRIEVYFDGNTPDPVPTIDWTSSAESPLTVAQVLEKGAQLDAGADSGKEVYVKGYVTQIDEIAAIKNEETGERYTNATYYIADAVAGESNQLYVFRGLGLNGAAFTSADDLAVSDEVIVVGKIKNFVNSTDGSTTIEVNQGNKLYSRNGNTGGDTPGPGPQPQADYTPQGDGTLGSPYNIDAIRSMDVQSTSEAVQTEVWVKGVVLGYITSSTLSENTIRVGVTPGDEVTKSNIVLIDENHNTVTAMPELAYMGPVNLPNGDVRDALNLADNSSLIGQTIWVCGDVLKYMGVPGIKNVKKYSLDGTTILPNGDTPGPGPGPDPQTIDWTSSADAPLTVAQALEKASKLEGGADSGKDVYVKGKISQIDEISPKLEDGSGYGNATYYISDDGTTTNQFYVFRGKSLNGADFTSADEIKVGDEVVVVGVIKNYVKSETSTLEFTQGNKLYSLNGQTGGDTPEPEYLELPSIARAKAAATNAGNGVNAVLKADNLLVTYVNGKSVYVFDGTDGLLLFASNASTNEGIKTGDKITADVKGQIKLYSGLTELAVTSYDNFTVNSSNNTVTPQTATIADITNNFSDYENELVTIAELTPAAESWANRNLTFTDDSDNELVVRDNWNVGTALTFDTSKTYGVTGFVAIYATEAASTVQLYPRSADDFNGDTGTIVYPDPRETALDNPYSVAELRALNATSTTELLQEGAFVVGYIVGYINGSSLSETSAIFSAEAPAAAASTRADDPTVSASNFLLADDPSCTDIAAVVPINLANNNPARTDLNLKDNPSRLGTKVWLQGNVRKYMGVTGLHNVKHYSTDGVDFTGVQAVQADTQVGNIYTVAGQRVESMTKPGVYVVGGKKVMK